MASATTIVALGNPSDASLQRLGDLVAALPDCKLIVTSDIATLTDDNAASTRIFFMTAPNQAQLRALLPRAPNLQWVHSKFAGVDKIMFPEFVANDSVTLTNGSGVWSRSLAEFVLGGMLFFAKSFSRLRRSQSEHKWDVFNMTTLGRQTVGIVGHGDIGRNIAQRCKAMGMRVLALRRDVSPRVGDEHVDAVYPTAQLVDMLPQCDYVVNSSPLTPSTHHMLSTAQFAAMKSSAIFINVGRGAVVDEVALVSALQNHIIAGAVLDVFEFEPLPVDSPLWDMDNVFMSSHCADHTTTAADESVDLLFAQLQRHLAGQPLNNVVDKHAGY